MEKTDLKSFTYEEAADFLARIGEPAYRAKQLYDWMHVKKAAAFDEMTNLPKNLRKKLEKECAYTALTAKSIQQSARDGTRKYLFELADGNHIESVLMRYRHGNSVCVSSQVGCRMGCRFCASTLDGVERNLTPGEILDQIYRIEADIGERVSNVVIMGMGEPFDNYDNVLRFIRMATDAHGANISGRNITLSTCGLVPRIYDLAEEDLTITLAVSLHAATQEKRMQLMPVAK
ncbi:MAG: radical SAM protein, partial [Lachnospiraceae bacterium]|nr:radical SAM protein [Lachnospiraceae bacterium]